MLSCFELNSIKLEKNIILGDVHSGCSEPAVHIRGFLFHFVLMTLSSEELEELRSEKDPQQMSTFRICNTLRITFFKCLLIITPK